MPDIVQTKNLTFDKEGYVKLSKPTIALYTSSDDGDFGMPVKYARHLNNKYMIATTGKSFFIGFLVFLSPFFFDIF